jgi:hypothetical protein
MNNWFKGFLWLSSLYWFNPIPGWAQDAIANPPPSQVETTAKSIDLKVGEVLRVKVAKLPTNPRGKIAVLLGNTDITSQIEIDGDELVYRSSLVPLTIGEQTLTVYQIPTTDRWNIIATFRIAVKPALAQVPTPTDTKPSSITTESSPSPPATTPASSTAATPPPAETPTSSTEATPPPTGTPTSSTEATPPPTETPASSTAATPPPTGTKFTVTPKFSINLKSQLLETRTPDAGASQRPTFLNVDFTGGFSTEYRVDKAKLKTKFTVVGTTFQPEALRFGEIQGRASQIDLSEYEISALVIIHFY